MAVTTTLTWNGERSFQKLLGNVSLRLLYKSSVHGENTVEMQNRCRCQGPIVTVIYHSNNIFGIFMLGHSSEKSKSFIEPNDSFFFSLQKNETVEMKTVVLNSTVTISYNTSEFNISSNDKQYLVLNFSTKCICIARDLEQELRVKCNPMFSSLECEVFRVEGMLICTLLYSDSILCVW